jgi:hypothetical protein
MNFDDLTEGTRYNIVFVNPENEDISEEDIEGFKQYLNDNNPFRFTGDRQVVDEIDYCQFATENGADWLDLSKDLTIENSMIIFNNLTFGRFQVAIEAVEGGRRTKKRRRRRRRRKLTKNKKY